MTVVIGVICDDGKVIVGSDAAISFGDGYRRLMSEGKWWNMGCLIIGESGDDFSLSRIRQKTVKHKPWTALRDPYTFSELVCVVQAEVKGDIGMEPLDCELLHVSGDDNNNPIIHCIGGDGGISGPYPYMAIGHGGAVAMPVLDVLLDPRHFKGKKSVIRVTNVIMETLERTAQYADSVSPPFFTRKFDPAAEFKEL